MVNDKYIDIIIYNTRKYKQVPGHFCGFYKEYSYFIHLNVTMDYELPIYTTISVFIWPGGGQSVFRELRQKRVFKIT